MLFLRRRQCQSLEHNFTRTTRKFPPGSTGDPGTKQAGFPLSLRVAHGLQEGILVKLSGATEVSTADHHTGTKKVREGKGPYRNLLSQLPLQACKKW